MTEFCIKIYRFFRNHRAVFWVSMIALYAFFGYFASKIYLEEDINKLMPSSKNEDGTTKLAFANLRIKDKTFLLFEGKNGASWAGGDPFSGFRQLSLYDQTLADKNGSTVLSAGIR